ncbi:SGNH/GDSL hydrolase family protein [Ferruginibacter yonginensis]|uniref:SGNH/GDSL hydrolase family protein n=1 Tax=Ferruginibacter yonginensis TaxID=1310416 RepID=A0ABV8QQT8_9BACT
MNISYLALGDSYTIGEAVLLSESYPYQTVQLLRKAGVRVLAPEIIAKTGWTTDELIASMEQTIFLPSYDVVSLLIGVNNQYRGRSVQEYKNECNHLIQTAIQLAGNNPKRVFVLSIPDWGKTPFAAERDVATIASEIDAFNSTCKQLADLHGCYYIDITTTLRADAANVDMVASDGLHPSKLAYQKWANTLAQTILEVGF